MSAMKNCWLSLKRYAYIRDIIDGISLRSPLSHKKNDLSIVDDIFICAIPEILYYMEVMIVRNRKPFVITYNFIRVEIQGGTE